MRGLVQVLSACKMNVRSLRLCLFPLPSASLIFLSKECTLSVSADLTLHGIVQVQQGELKG